MKHKISQKAGAEARTRLLTRKAKTPKPQKAEVVQYICKNCHEPATSGDYCHGCKTAVCEKCTRNDSVMGFTHEWREHLVEGEY